MINTIIIKDYFRRHYLIIPLAVFWVFFWFYVEENTVEKALYTQALFMASVGPFMLYRSRWEIKALATLPESKRRLSMTLFFTAIIVLPLVDLVCLAIGWLVVGLYNNNGFPFMFFHIPLVFIAAIAWAGSLLWMFLADMISMAKKGKNANESAVLRPFNLFILWFVPFELSLRKPKIPIEAGLTLLALGLFLTYQAWRKVPCLFGPPSVQPVQTKAKRLELKTFKRFRLLTSGFFFGVMISSVFAGVTIFLMTKNSPDFQDSGRFLKGMFGPFLFMIPMLSIGVIWRWTSAIRAFRSLPLPPWRITVIYAQILLAVIMGLFSMIGISIAMFHEYSLLGTLLLCALLTFCFGMLLYCAYLRWHMWGTVAVIFGYSMFYMSMTVNALWSQNPANGQWILQEGTFAKTVLLLILAALCCCYWLYRLIAYNSNVYRCAADGNTRL